MEVYFLRHGQALGMEAWKGADVDRPLAAEGVERMEREAAAIASRGIAPNAIITSPCVRARQTAEIVARHLRLPDAVTIDDRLAPGFGPDQLGRILNERNAVAALLLVGHEPDFSRTIARCIGGGRVEMKTGGLARVILTDAAALSGTLSWLVPAGLLAP